MQKEIKWSIDQAHSSITFRVRYLMISHVTGSFKTFDASVYTTGKDFSTAVIDVWIDAASIETGDEKRDSYLTGEDFFDTQDFKQNNNNDINCIALLLLTIFNKLNSLKK